MVGAKKIASLLAAVLSFDGTSAAVPAHSKFKLKDGTIESLVDQAFRLNLKGGDLHAGDRAVLWNCNLHVHEKFNMSGGQIHLMHNQNMCLNAKGGVGAGNPIVTFGCGAGGVITENEEFVHGRDGRIRLKQHPEMCMNIKGNNIGVGTEIVLWPCGKNSSHVHDIFEYKDNAITVKANPDLHFNVKGGDLSESSEVVLFNCHAHTHEIFDFENQQIKVRGTNLCLHAEGGLAPGRNLIAWQCNEDKKRGDNELFEYDEKRKVIYSVKQPSLGFNIKENNISPGSEIIIWPLDHSEL